jgi:hypothetical protein
MRWIDEKDGKSGIRFFKTGNVIVVAVTGQTEKMFP